jgi:hypothetical protein
MKKSTQILGLISALLFFTGTVFKSMHWAGAGVIITLAVPLFVFGYFLMYTLDRNKLQDSGLFKGINFISFVLTALIGFSFLFKIQHWPGAGVLFYAGHISFLLIIILQFIAISKISDQAIKTRWLNTTYFLIVFLGFSLLMGFRQPLKSDLVTAVAADKMNVIYAGIENPLSIAVSNISPDRIMATVDKGTIKPFGKGKYSIKIPIDSIPEENIVKIKLFSSPEVEESNLICTNDFRIKKVPEPTPYFGEVANGEIAADLVKSTRTLNVKLENFVFSGIEYKVTKYRLVYVPKKGNASLFEGSGDQLTEKMTGILAGVMPGDMIIFANLEVSNPDLGVIKLENGITLTVK